MKIHYNKDFDCYMVAECHKTDVIELDGVKLIPITELEKIREEIEKDQEQMANEKDWGRYYGMGWTIRIIDNHIAELKGENKECPYFDYEIGTCRRSERQKGEDE